MGFSRGPRRGPGPWGHACMPSVMFYFRDLSQILSFSPRGFCGESLSPYDISWWEISTFSLFFPFFLFSIDHSHLLSYHINHFYTFVLTQMCLIPLVFRAFFLILRRIDSQQQVTDVITLALCENEKLLVLGCLAFFYRTGTQLARVFSLGDANYFSLFRVLRTSSEADRSARF